MATAEPTRDTIPTLIRWAEARALVRAVLITSTRAVPGAPVDVLSDYDVILIVQELGPLVDDRSWPEDFGETLVVYWDSVEPDPVFGIEQSGNVTQCTDGLKIDFSLWPISLGQSVVAAPDLMDDLDAGYRVLLNKDSLTEALQPPTYAAYIPKRPSAVDYHTWINDFLTDPPYVAKCLWRDGLLPAKWCLDYDMKHVYLRQVLEWRVENDRNWSVPVGNLVKGQKKRLPPDIWAQVEASYAGGRIADNWEALTHTIALFRRVAVEVGTALGYANPEELHQDVVAYIEQIRSLPSPDAPGDYAAR